MKIEDRLDKMKRVYLDTSVSDETVISEWQMLKNVLGEQQRTYISPLIFRAFIFAAIILVLSGGVVSLAQASKPGELLYPVKEFSQKVVEEVQKTSPVFNTAIPTPTDNPTVKPTVIPQKNEHEDQRVQGINDENKNDNRRSEKENIWRKGEQEEKEKTDYNASKKESNDNKDEDSGNSDHQEGSDSNEHKQEGEV